ncbi:4EBP3 protein, partial [Trogon melanurus]|nr:4EBP3 protein [Trogon melanurus]
TATSSCPIPGSDRRPDPEGCSSTPGGTVYATTPGGTRIIYDRKFLLECKNSPVARTPPCCLPQIPGVTSLAQSSLVKLEELKERNESEEATPGEQPGHAGP